MPVYQYKARDRAGEQVSGSVTAASEDDLASALQQQDIFLTSARARSQGKVMKASGKRLPLSQLIAFCYQVQTITAAGVSIIEGLESLAQDNQSPALMAVMTELVNDIKQGSTLSEAMERRGGAFPDLVVSLVQAGEATGQLDMAMGRAGDYLRWWSDTRSALIQATIYPGILMTAVGGLVLLMLTFLVPRITGMFAKAGTSLPLPTQILVSVSGFLCSNWIVIGVGLTVATVGFVMWKRTPGGRYRIDNFKLRIPVIGTLMRKIFAARFTNTFCVLHKAGVNVVNALEISGRTVGNAVMSRAVEKACEEVRQGHTISEALSSTGEFQPLVTRMVAVGESSGSLGETMERVNEFYDREVTRGSKAMLAVLEPVMVAASGGAVGFILLCCFLPLFQILKTVRGR